MDTLKTYPDLNRAAIASNQSEMLRLWYMLRRIHPDGRVDLAFCENGLDGFFNLRKMRRLIKQGMGNLWRLGTTGKYLYLAGLEDVCQYFDVVPSLVVVPLPLSAFLTATEFRAYSYAASFVDQPGIASRETLCRLWGQSDNTLRRWEKIAHIASAENICQNHWPSPDVAPLTPCDLDNPKSYTHFYGYKHCNYRSRFRIKFLAHLKAAHPQQPGGIYRNAWMCWRLPNTYSTALDRTNPGQTWRVRKSLRAKQAINSSPASWSTSSRDCASATRYCDNFAAASSASRFAKSVYTIRSRSDGLTIWKHSPGQPLLGANLG